MILVSHIYDFWKGRTGLCLRGFYDTYFFFFSVPPNPSTFGTGRVLSQMVKGIKLGAQVIALLVLAYAKF